MTLQDIMADVIWYEKKSPEGLLVIDQQPKHTHADTQKLRQDSRAENWSQQL